MVDAKKILVADDEEQLALALKVRLESRGYQVTMVHNGQQALERVTAEPPDLVILDVLMPVMDGYSCVRELNKLVGRGKIPIIILTARERLKDLFELEGVEDYVVKPFDHEDLLIRIERIFKKRQAGKTPAPAV